MKAIAKDCVKAQAREILGFPGANLLTQGQRQTLWRIGFQIDPITAADKYAIDRILDSVRARAA